MSQNWSIIVPQATTNLVANPSFEVNTAGWASSGSNTIARSSNFQFSGVFSLLCTYINNLTLASYAVASGVLTAAETYTITARLYVPDGWDGGDINLDATGFTSATITQVKEWDSVTGEKGKFLELKINLSLSSDTTGSIILETSSSPSSGKFVYLDSVQLESGSWGTTYCDGDQPGCSWNGAAHAATSSRDEFEASGGRVMNLDTDFEFLTGPDEGTGVFPLQILSHPQPLLPGDSFQGINVQSRSNLLLRGGFEGETTPAFHAKRQALIKALNSRVGPINRPPQARQLIYHGAAVEKQIGVHYVAGLGVKDRIGTLGERIDGLQFYAPDPAWYGRGERGAVLNAGDTAASRLIVGYIGGAWSVMGPPSASGTYFEVRAIVADDRYVYIGGSFSNWDGIANADNIVRYEKSTGTYSALGTGANDAVQALALDSSGNLWAGGLFTSIGGVTTDNLAMWNGSSWSAPGTPTTSGNQEVRDILVGKDGKIYVSGDFINFDGIANADYIVYWNGSSWNAMSTGANGAVIKMALASNGDVYMVGNFTTIGGVSANRVAKWNGSSFSALGSGINGIGNAVAIDNFGDVYVGGNFTSPANYIAKWNGAAWSSLGGDVNSQVYCLLFNGSDLYASGLFTSAGGLSLANRFARWNGSAWSHVDIGLPGTPIPFTLYLDRGDLYVGYNSTGDTAYSAETQVPYSGSERAYPTVSISRSGGTSARLASLRFSTIGAEILFDYPLLDGETLTIVFHPDNLSVESSQFGSVPAAILPGSDTASFYLTSGNSSDAQTNTISCFVYQAGSPTVTAVMRWRDTYQSYD